MWSLNFPHFGAICKKSFIIPNFGGMVLKKTYQQAKIGSVLNLLLRSKATKSITMVATCRNMATIKDWYVSQKHFHEKKFRKQISFEYKFHFHEKISQTKNKMGNGLLTF